MGRIEKQRCTLETLKLMREVRALFLCGMTRKDIAKKMHLSASYVGQLLISAGIGQDKLPLHDKPEEIANCLACKRSECVNCLASKKAYKRR